MPENNLFDEFDDEPVQQFQPPARQTAPANLFAEFADLPDEPTRPAAKKKKPDQNNLFAEFADLPDEPEGQDGAWSRGLNQAKSSADFSREMATGDYTGAAQNIADLNAYKAANPGMAEGKDLKQAWDSGNGILGGVKNVAGEIAKDYREAPTTWEGIKATGRNVRAMGEGVIEQTPNMIAPMAGMLAGGAVGSTAGPIGTAAGAFAGATAGNTLVEGQGMAMQEMQKAGIDLNDSNAVADYLEANSANLFGKTLTKGAIIGAIDTATMGLGNFLLREPAKAASARALADMGVDLFDKAAVKTAMQSPDFASRMAADAAYQATKTGANAAARNVGAAALEPAGEFAGEFIGQGVATSDWDTKNAALEAFSSIGQSGATFAGQKAYQMATRPKEAAQLTPPPGPIFKALDAIQPQQPITSFADIENARQETVLQKDWDQQQQDAILQNKIRNGSPLTEEEKLRTYNPEPPQFADDDVSNEAILAKEQQRVDEWSANLRQAAKPAYSSAPLEDVEAREFAKEAANYTRQRNVKPKEELPPAPPPVDNREAQRRKRAEEQISALYDNSYGLEGPPKVDYATDQEAETFSKAALSRLQRKQWQEGNRKYIAQQEQDEATITDANIPAEVKRQARIQAASIVSADPVYQHMEEAKKRGGLNLEAFKADYDKTSVDQIIRRYPGIFSRVGTIKPDEFAAEQGYESLDDMVQKFAHARTKRELQAKIVRDLHGQWQDAEAAMQQDNTDAEGRRKWTGTKAAIKPPKTTYPASEEDIANTINVIQRYPESADEVIDHWSFSPAQKQRLVAARDEAIQRRQNDTVRQVANQNTEQGRAIKAPAKPEATGNNAQEPWATAVGRETSIAENAPQRQENGERAQMVAPNQALAQGQQKATETVTNQAPQGQNANTRSTQPPTAENNERTKAEQENNAGNPPAELGRNDRAQTAGVVKRGEIGGKLASGEVRLTSSGRETTPFPKVSTDTNRKASNTLKAVDQWLISNAADEARARGDEFNLRQFEGIKSPTQADKDSAEMYLFDDNQPPVIPSILKPLTTQPTQPQGGDPISPAPTGKTAEQSAARQYGARKQTKEGAALVKSAQEELRKVINNPDIVGKQRAERIANGRNLVGFLQANAAKKLETGYDKGDQIAFTGEDAPEGFRSFIYLEGSKAGQYGVKATEEAKAADAARTQKEWQDQQESFKRLKQSAESAQSPAASRPQPTTPLASQSEDVSRKEPTSPPKADEAIEAGQSQRSEGTDDFSNLKNSVATSPAYSKTPHSVFTLSRINPQVNASGITSWQDGFTRAGLKQDTTQQDIINELQKVIGAPVTAWSLPDTLVAKKASGRVAIQGTPKSDFEAAERLARIFGKKVVWSQITANYRVNGLMVQNNPKLDKHIFIDLRSPLPMHTVFGHELTHHIEKDMPRLFNDIYDAIQPFIKDVKKYQDLRKLEGMTERELRTEIVADFMGDNFASTEFWQAVQGKTGNRWQRIARHIMSWIDNLLGRVTWGTTYGSEQFVSDVKAAREILAKGVREYAGAQKGQTVEGDQDVSQSAAGPSENLVNWLGKSKVKATVYHGSQTFGQAGNFTFDPNRATGKTSSPGRGLGTFFTEDPIEARAYAGASGAVESLRLRIENPLEVNSYDLPRFQNVEEARAFRKRKELQGYDGIHIVDEGHWVIFEPGQAKSADKNNGEYSQTDNDIRRSAAVRKGLLASWTPDRLQNEIEYSAYNNGNAKAVMGFVDPKDFIDATTNFLTKYDILRAAGELDLQRLSKETQTPFLRVNEDSEILDHEGRHRMAALANAGVTRVPIVLDYRRGALRKAQTSLQLTGQDLRGGRGATITVENIIPLTYENTEALQSALSEGNADVKFSVAAPPMPDEYAKNRAVTRSAKQRVIRATQAFAANVVEGADKFFGSISSRLKAIHPKIEAKIRTLDFNIGTKMTRDVKSVQAMLDKAKKMSRADFADWDFARKNGDIDKINELIQKYDLQKEYDAYRKTLDYIREEANDVGMDVGYIENYSPRVLKDAKGFLNAIGRGDDWPVISRALQKRADDLGISVAEMTQEMKADIVSNMLYGGATGMGGPRGAKERTIKKIPAHLNQYYMHSDAALVSYIHSMRKHIEIRRFFGKIPENVADLKSNMHRSMTALREEEGKDSPNQERIDTLKSNIAEYRNKLDAYKYQRDYTENIGQYVIELMAEHVISPEQERTLTEIFKARFHEAGTRGLVQAYKNLSYLDTMGSVISAITQIGDLAWSAYDNGWLPTLKNTYKSIRKDVRITKEDVGIERIAQEFADTDTLSNAVAKVFKYVGLEKMDSIGKETFLNSALEKFEKQAAANPEKLKKEIQHIFEDETDSVIADLQSKEITDNVKLLVYSNLLDFQPAALSEMPEQYLKAGNGRVFYMLKSYTLKQFDVFRREVYTGLKNGDKTEKIAAMRNMMYLASVIVLANAGADELKDVVLGRETSLSDRLTDNILRLFGVSKYVTWQARQDGIGSAALKQILPPIKFIDSVYKDISNAGDGKGLYSTASIPVVGKLAYWHMGRGQQSELELFETRLAKQKKRLNIIKDKVDADPGLAREYREEMQELAKINKFQARLNRDKQRINRMKARKDGDYSKRIASLEQRRADMLESFLSERG